MNQGNRNANDAIALAQTMEGGLDEITNMLQRMRTLAVQANNGINTADDKKAIAQEMGQLTVEISRIADQTTYGGKTILGGYDTGTVNTSIFGASGSKGGQTNKDGYNNQGKITFQIGANSGDTVSIEINSFQFSMIAHRVTATTNATGMEDFGLTTIGTNGKAGISTSDVKSGKDYVIFDVEGDGEAGLAIDTIDKMIADVDSQRSALGAIQNRLESSIRVQSNVATNESDARSRIRDTDFAEESANLSQQSIIQQAATSMLMQANARPQIGLSLLG